MRLACLLSVGRVTLRGRRSPEHLVSPCPLGTQPRSGKGGALLSQDTLFSFWLYPPLGRSGVGRGAVLHFVGRLPGRVFGAQLISPCEPFRAGPDPASAALGLPCPGSNSWKGPDSQEAWWPGKTWSCSCRREAALVSCQGTVS